MAALKFLFLPLALFLLTSCMMGYLIESSYHQQKILRARQPITKILNEPDVPAETKHKLQLVQEAKNFAEKKLALNQTNNYESYVALDRPYVTWIVRASEAYELKSYQWWFPLVGNVPYKGYFSEKDALEEAQTFEAQKFDTYVRGVTAYSTLGWFDDPIISPMLSYEDHDLVELIIHEMVHATLFIKSQADFNERLATFVGQEGAKLFYLEKEGPASPTLKLIEDNWHDTQKFSDFIGAEMKALREWYHQLKPEGKNQQNKTQKIKEMQARFKEKVLPQLRTSQYRTFGDRKLNNAMLLSYETYIQDLSDFAKLFQQLDNHFKKFLEKCKKLEWADDPQAQLKTWLR